MVERGWSRGVLTSRVLVGSTLGRIEGLSRGDEVARAGELLGSSDAAICEQAVVSDAVKALGKDVDEETADELARLQGHGLVPAGAFDAIVLKVTPLASAEIKRLLEIATRWV